MDNNNIRRSVLFLLNGFGMDRKDIYDIINDDTASYINQIAQTGLFGSLENINSNFKGGFRTFSTSERSLPGYKRLQKDLDENFVNNPKALEMINKIKSRKR